MPYTSEWVQPEVFFEYNGVKVYHTYKNDDMSQGQNQYWYTLDGASDGHQFDVRDLPGFNGRHATTISAALEAGLLELPEEG